MSMLNILVGRRPELPHTMTTTPASTLFPMISGVDNSTTYSLAHSKPMTAFILIVTLLLTAGCVLGNILVIVSVLLVHKLKTACNYLIVSLAVSDLLVGLFVMPLSIAYVILGYWPLGLVGCAVWVTLDVTLCTASILNLMMITIDRYMVITHPFRYAERRTARLMAMYIAVAWTISLLIGTTPLMVNWGPEFYHGKCMVNQEQGYQVYATVGAFYIPLAVMIAMYGKIFHIVWKIKKAEAKNNPHPPISNNNSNSSPLMKHRVDYRNGHTVSHLAEKDDLKHNNHQDVIVIVSDADTIKHDISTIDENQERVSDYDHPSDHEHDDMLHHRASPKKHRLSVVSLGSHHDRRNSLRKFSIATLNSIKNFIHRHKSHHARNSHAVRTLGVIMGSFTICWLPFFVLALTAPFCGDACSILDDKLSWLFPALTWLGYANSCLNPIIYASFNREFRTPFKEIMCCRCKTINKSVRHSDYLHQSGMT